MHCKLWLEGYKMKIGIGALITAIMAFVAWVIKKLKKWVEHYS